MRPYTPVRVGRPRSPEWHAARRQGIGSSDAANVLALGRFGTPLTVWDEKTGTPPEKPDTAQMSNGRAFEDTIARVWAETTGRRIIRPPALIRSRKYPCLQASLDYAVVDGAHSRTPIAPLEVKAVWHGAREWDNGVPAHYAAQVIHQLIVLDLPLGHVAALINGDVRAFEVTADDALRADVARELTAWWDRHVVRGERPPLDPTPDAALMARIAPQPLRPARDATGNPDVARNLIRMVRHGNQASEHEQARKAARDALCAWLDDAQDITWDGEVIATWRPDSNGRRVLRPARTLPDDLYDHEDMP